MEKYNKIPEKSNNLDAKQLNNISYSQNEKWESFHTEKFDLTEDGFLGIHYILDYYFNLLEPEGDIDDINTFSPEFRQIRNNLYNYISSLEGVTLDNLGTIQITENGIMKLALKDGRIITLNLIDEWNKFREPIANRRVIEQSQKEQKELQENISRDSFLGGSVIYEYSEYIGAAGVGIPVSYATYKAWEKLYQLSTVLVETPDGKQKIEFQNPYYWTKKELKSILNQILESYWFEYDPVQKKIISPAKEFINKAQENFRTITYEEAKKSNLIDQNKIKTEAEFEKLKLQAIEKAEPFFEKIKSWKLPLKGWIWALEKIFPTTLWEAFFWPVFFHKAKKEETPMSLIEAWIEMWAFHIGAKLGARAWIGWTKAITSLVGGGLSVMWTHYFNDEVLEATRKKWQYFDKSNYSPEKSAFFHATGLMIGEWSDTIQWAKNIGYDIGIPKTNVNVPFFGHLFQIPEITFYQRKVNLGTSAQDWLRDATNRTVDDWNHHVDNLKIHLTEDIYELLGEYHRNQWLFEFPKEIENAWWKKKLLEIELEKIIKKDGSSEMFRWQIEKIKKVILFEVDNLNSSQTQSTEINEVINLAVDSMKINNLSLSNYQLSIAMTEAKISNWINNLPISDDEKKFLQSLPAKMESNSELFDNEEQKEIYNNLLDSEVDYNGKELGLIIAYILDDMAKNNQEKYFIKQLQSWNNKWYEWSFF